jgi:hypothetical protein
VLLRDLRTLPVRLVADIEELIAATAGPYGPDWVERQVVEALLAGPPPLRGKVGFGLSIRWTRFDMARWSGHGWGRRLAEGARAACGGRFRAVWRVGVPLPAAGQETPVAAAVADWA